MKSKSHQQLRCLTECSIFVAAALALSYLKIPLGFTFGGFGGSIDLVMIPLVIAAFRWGLGWGIGAGLVFGTLKYFLASGGAISWVSIIFDYSVAYMAVGLAGLFYRKYKLVPVAALVGCVARFLVHFISGITVYKQYMPDEFMGITGMTPVLYSTLYNGTYMLPNTILAVVVCALLIPAVLQFRRIDK